MRLGSPIALSDVDQVVLEPPPFVDAPEPIAPSDADQALPAPPPPVDVAAAIPEPIAPSDADQALPAPPPPVDAAAAIPEPVAQPQPTPPNTSPAPAFALPVISASAPVAGTFGAAEPVAGTLGAAEPVPENTVGAPIDPLDDFDVFNAIEDAKEARGYDPDDPGIAGTFWEGIKHVVGMVPPLVRGLRTFGFAGQNPREALALLSQTSGEVLGNFSNIGAGGVNVGMKGVAALTGIVRPDLAPELKTLTRRASWDYAREVRDMDKFLEKFNSNLELIFPSALKDFGSIPVDRQSAQALAMVADPTNFIPAGAAAKWSATVPLRGAVRAVKTAANVAGREYAEAVIKRDAIQLALQSTAGPAERGVIFRSYQAADAAAREALAKRNLVNSRLVRTVNEQSALVAELAEASSPLLTTAVAGTARALGAGLEAVGNVATKAAGLPERLATAVAGTADETARTAIASGVRNVTGLFGALPAVSGATGTLSSIAGRDLQAFGRLLAEAESQLPFFKRVARETSGLGKVTASFIDQSGLGAVVTPAFVIGAEASRGMPLAFGIGWVAGGGDLYSAVQAAGGGSIFGLAGAGYGQWRQFASGARYQQQQYNDVVRYRRTLPGSDAINFFDNLPRADRAALATMQLAHPDLAIKYDRLGRGRPSFYYAAEDGPVAVINLDSRDPVSAIAAHEVSHHISRHGFQPAVERILFGDPLLKQPGLYTLRDAGGNPVVGADGRYALNPEWQSLKDGYNERLRAYTNRTGERVPPRDDAAMAREIFAEHGADYLLGRSGAMYADLRSTVWSPALEGLASTLVGSVPALRQMVGKLGIPLASSRRVVGSALFPGGLPASPELSKIVREYVRRSARGNVSTLGDEPGNTRYTIAEVTQHPEVLNHLFDGTDDVARGRDGKVLRDKSGAPRFLTPREQREQRAALAGAIVAELEKVPISGARYQKTPEGEGWSVPGLPSSVVDNLEASGRFNPVQIAHLRHISNMVGAGAGQSALFFYQPALARGRYASLAGDWRTETPYQMFISKAGNVLFRTISREKLISNAQELVSKRRAGLWSQQLPDLVRDIDTYLANHVANQPGETGIGIEKRNQINALFGIDTKANAAANPFVEMNPRAPIVIRSRRIDRTNQLTPVAEYFPTNYDKLNQNLRPMRPDEGGLPGRPIPEGADLRPEDAETLSLRAIDKVGLKAATQVGAGRMLYPANPVPESVVLPPRWGLVNRNVAGMPRGFAEVQTLLDRVEARLRYLAKTDPDFALKSAQFYPDMARAAETMADVVQPGIKGHDKALLSELQLRYLALASPRTNVSANATKSAGSLASGPGSFEPGRGMGFGSAQAGAKETAAAWKRGEHFNLEATGIDDKVRSFYINGLSEIIEGLQVRGEVRSADELMLRAGKSLHLVSETQTAMSPTDRVEIQRHLDGKATVDMWDMAAKGEAVGGFLLRRGARPDPKQPFAWTQDKFAVIQMLSDPAWRTVQRDLKVQSPADLRYQQARSLRIDGFREWNAENWAERRKLPFGPETEFTTFTQKSEAGLSPGGAGPVYDAQQAVDGLLADRLNAAGMAGVFGKTKLKARDSQQILWAIEKQDNPIQSNNALELFGDTFGSVAQELDVLRLGEKMAKGTRAAAFLAGSERAYNEMARQQFPFEVGTDGVTTEAKIVQEKLKALAAGGDLTPERTIVESLADGLGKKVNDLASKHNIPVTVDEVHVAAGAYTMGEKVIISPHTRLVMRGRNEWTTAMRDIVSRALDQEAGNLMRHPTVRELNDPKVNLAHVFTFHTAALPAAARDAFFVGLSKLQDAQGKPFLTGFTEVTDGIAIGDQFYKGDILSAFKLRAPEIAALMVKHKVPGSRTEKLVIETYARGSPLGQAEKTAFAQELTSLLQDKVRQAAPAQRQFPQMLDAVAYHQERIATGIARMATQSKTAAKETLTGINQGIDAALLRDQLTELQVEALKQRLPK